MASKSDFVNQMAEELGSTKRHAAEATAAIEAIVKRQLDNEGEAMIPGVGKIKLVKKPAHDGRNPRTGEKILIPEKIVAKMSLFKSLAG